MQTQIIYRFDQEDETLYEAVRIIAKTVTIRDVGMQNRMAKQAAEQWWAEKPENKSLSEPPKGPLEPAPDEDKEQIVKYNAYQRWSICAAGTYSIETIKRTDKTKDLDEDNAADWPWQPSSMATLGWDKPEGIYDLKTDLFDAWERAVHAANPGVFGRALTSAAKKKTGVIFTT